MDKHLHDIDNLFKERLENYAEEPGSNVWQAVDNFLDKQEAEKYKRKYSVLLKTVACIVLLLAGLLVTDIATRRTPIKVTGHSNKNTDSIIDGNSLQNGTMKSEKKYSTESSQSESHIANEYKTVLPVYSKSNTMAAVTVPGENIHTDFLFSKKFVSADDVMLYSTKKISAANSLSVVENNLEKQASLLINLSANNNEAANSKNTQHISLKNHHPFSIIPFGSLDYMTSRLYDGYKNDGQNISDYRNREQPDMSYTLGLLLEYSVSKKLSLQTGFSIAHSFTSIAPVALKAIPDNAGGYTFKLPTTYGYAEIRKPGTQNGDSVLVSSAMQHLRYNSIPVLVKFLVKPGKINMHATAGTAFNFITAATTEVDYTTASSSNEKETIQKIEGINKSFVTLIAGAEINWMMNKKISFGINPVVRYAVTPVNNGTPVKTFPVSLGVAAALHVKL